MVKNSKFILHITLLITLSSCASIFGKKEQIVTLKSEQEVVFFMENDSIGKGKSVNVKLTNDKKSDTRITLKADGYYDKKDLVYYKKRNPLRYLSLLFFGFPYFIDAGPKSFLYDEEYVFESLYPVKYKEKKEKWILLDDINIKYNENYFNFAIFTSDEWFDKEEESDYQRFEPLKDSSESRFEGKKPSTIESIDSSKFEIKLFKKNVRNILNKSNFNDSLGSVFSNYSNTNFVSCNILSTEIIHILNSVKFDEVFDVCKVNIETEWITKNIYGDTISIDTIKNYSDNFPGEIPREIYSSASGNTSYVVYKFMEDTNAVYEPFASAIENATILYLDLMKTKQEILIEKEKEIEGELIKILSSDNKVQSVEDAIKSTVTIINGDEHCSGFFISKDGYIITNYHFVKNDSLIKVKTNDGKEFKAKLIRHNKFKDLSLLKIEYSPEYTFTIPNSKNYDLGYQIYAIGTPKSIELGQSVTKGILSSIRSKDEITYLQSDMSINYGNGGGPVISKEGELIGVVDWKISGFATEGLSFSLPAEEIMKALKLSY